MTDQRRNQREDLEQGTDRSQQEGSNREMPGTADDRGMEREDAAGDRENDQLESELGDSAMDETGATDDELDSNR